MHIDHLLLFLLNINRVILVQSNLANDATLLKDDLNLKREGLDTDLLNKLIFLSYEFCQGDLDDNPAGLCFEELLDWGLLVFISGD